MSDKQVRLERRATLLAEALTRRKNLIRDQLAPPGGRPVFHDAKTTAEALDWWRQHRYDQYGQQVLASYAPDKIAELDAWLAANMQGGPADGTA